MIVFDFINLISIPLSMNRITSGNYRIFEIKKIARMIFFLAIIVLFFYNLIF